MGELSKDYIENNSTKIIYENYLAKNPWKTTELNSGDNYTKIL